MSARAQNDERHPGTLMLGDTVEKPHKPLEPPPSPTPPSTVGEEIEEKLDEAVDNTFPASDPVAFISQPDDPEEPPADPLAPPRSKQPPEHH